MGHYCLGQFCLSTQYKLSSNRKNTLDPVQAFQQFGKTSAVRGQDGVSFYCKCRLFSNVKTTCAWPTMGWHCNNKQSKFFIHNLNCSVLKKLVDHCTAKLGARIGLCDMKPQ